MNSTDKEWEKFGRDDPYFGVISHEKFKSNNLDDTLKEEFFQTGFKDIQHAIAQIQKHLDPDFKIQNALDFGCGVGRVLIPIAELADQATGVDVSRSMLQEAAKNCNLRSITNVTFVEDMNNLSSVGAPFDFIHSSIVFQHIPVKKGIAVFRNLLQYLSGGGCAALHFTYAKDSRIRSLISLFKKYIPLGKNIINLLNKKPFLYPTMQVNNYNLNKLILLLHQTGIQEFFTEFTDHGGDLGIVLYFRKPEDR